MAKFKIKCSLYYNDYVPVFNVTLVIVLQINHLYDIKS